jgi:hypothetical protein
MDNLNLLDPVPDQPSLNHRFHPLSPLSALSSVDALSKLKDFVDNPFFKHYVDLLQNEADQVVGSIAEGLPSDGNLCSILNREQMIGAGPAFLKFYQLVEKEHTELTAEANAQHVQN